MSGRAKRIQDIMSRAESLPQSSGQPSFPATASSGRASRLLQFRDHISGYPEGRGSETSAKIARGDRSFFASSASQQHESPSFEKLPPNVPLEYRGKSGTPVEGTANYIRLEHHSDKPVCEYEVVFTPFIESKKLRAKILHSFKEEIGLVYIYNGTNLFVPNPLKMALFTLETVSPATSQPVSIRIELRRYRKLSECVFIFNLLFRKIMHLLDMKRINRSNFDPKSPQMIPQHNLEIWPGYVTAVDEFNGGLLLCLDCCFKVLNTQTVLELIKSIRFAQTHDFQRLSAKLLIGQSVLTRYNNRNYVVEEILWDKTPKDTFTLADGRVISYIQYYREHYNIEIRETSQPLLLNRQTKISPQTASVSDQIVVIVPELCYLTGLREEMRTDMRVMKDVANFTRLTPNQRMNTLRKFIGRVNQHPECLRLLSDWNLKLQNATIDISLRVLDPETIFFGSGAMHYGTAEADWTMACGKSRVFDARDITNWVILYSNKDRSVYEQFADTFLRQSQFLGIKVIRPMAVALFDDRTDTYVSKIKEALQNNCQLIVVISPSQREDRYAAIKKVCCVDIPVPSQVVQVRTLNNPKRHRSVVQKIVMQVNCKLGGSLWAVKIPFKNWMICGVDIYHTKDISGQSVAAFVSTTHDSCTRWYSTVAMNNRSEITNGLTSCFERALKEYQKENNYYPSYVVIYRDGVGDGQISACVQFEIPQLQRCIEKVMKDPLHNGNQIDLCYVVVQKRINTRFFTTGREGHTNPPPGTVLDHQVTRRNYNDFFLVSQHVRQGTINPVHYIIAHDSKNTNPDRIQLLTFKMCHLYYNWAGTIRVPAPCQYAHKMAYLIGQSIRKVPAPELSNRLFYL